MKKILLIGPLALLGCTTSTDYSNDKFVNCSGTAGTDGRFTCAFNPVEEKVVDDYLTRSIHITCDHHYVPSAVSLQCFSNTLDCTAPVDARSTTEYLWECSNHHDVHERMQVRSVTCSPSVYNELTAAETKATITGCD